MEMNPYQPPVAEPNAPLGAGTEILATRGARLGAAIIDAIAVLLVNGVVLWATGLFEDLMRTPDDFGLVATATTLGFFVWLVIQISFLRDGQTLGKRLVGLRMVDYATGGPVPLGRLLLLRYLPLQFVGVIPILGRIIPIVDVLFIFGAEQRCVHDLMAGTKVVQA
jgi:uncharacterized RDD family membrane protein YckC